MEEEMYYSMVKDKISANNAAMVVDIRAKINEIIQLIYDKKPNNAIINQLKNIITIINDNQQKLDKLIYE